MTASLAGMAAVLASAGVVSAGLAGIGAAEALVASWLVGCFARQRMTGPPVVRPPVTVLKPLHGNEPLLRQALATLCGQDYPDFQIVFGVQDAADPAVAVVRRLRAGFPDLDIALTIDPTLHGRNRKVGNLINMMAAARHDVLVIADADVHVSPDGRHANIVVALRGTEREARESLAALEHASGYLRHELATRLSLRHVPELRFQQDKNPDVESRIDFLLRRAKKSRRNAEN